MGLLINMNYLKRINKKTYIKEPLLKSMNMLYNYYWSSSENVSYSSDAWYMFFNIGTINKSAKSNEYSVRCVRGGE